MLAYITYFIVTVIIRFVQLEANLAAAGTIYKTKMKYYKGLTIDSSAGWSHPISINVLTKFLSMSAEQ